MRVKVRATPRSSRSARRAQSPIPVRSSLHWPQWGWVVPRRVARISRSHRHSRVAGVLRSSDSRAWPRGGLQPARARADASSEMEASRSDVAVVDGRRSLRGEAGYTMFELLVVVTILGTVLVGLTTSFAAGLSAESGSIRRTTAQENARLALSRMRVDIHCASASPAPQENPFGGFTLTLTETASVCPSVTTTSSGVPVVHDPRRGLHHALAALPLPRDDPRGLRRRLERDARRRLHGHARLGLVVELGRLADAGGLEREPLADASHLRHGQSSSRHRAARGESGRRQPCVGVLRGP